MLALGAGLYHLENLADLSEVPEAGAFLVVAPIKLEGGSGGPVRVFAIIALKGDSATFLARRTSDEVGPAQG